MFHKHAIAHAHTCLYSLGQPKRAKMTTNRKIVLKLQALYYKRKNKNQQISTTPFGKKSRYRYVSIFLKNRDIDTIQYIVTALQKLTKYKIM